MKRATEVRAQLQNIQRWGQTSTATPVSPAALKALATMATSDQSTLDAAQSYAEYIKQRDAIVSSYVTTVSEWLNKRTNVLTATLAVPGLIEVKNVVAPDAEELFRARTSPSTSKHRGALEIPGHDSGYLAPQAAIGIALRRTADMFRDRVRSLYFVICTERRLRYGAPRVPSDPAVVVWLVPYVVDLSFVSGFINRRKYATQAFRSAEFLGEQMSVSLRTTVSGWPGDMEAYERTIQEAVELFVEHIAEAAKGYSERG